MTREEAIQWLKVINTKEFGWDEFALQESQREIRERCEQGVREAIDMAIEALQREEAEEKGYCHRIKPKEYFKNDAINRADAMAEFREWVKRANENGETPTWNDAVSLIGSLPSAEQVTSKLNNPCDSLLTDESNGSKEHKSKLDLISRQDVIEALCRSSVYAWSIEQDQTAHDWALNIINALPSADAVQGYTEWLEKIVVNNGSNEWLCEDTPDTEWCKKNCHYSSIQAECLRHLYEVSKGGDTE